MPIDIFNPGAREFAEKYRFVTPLYNLAKLLDRAEGRNFYKIIITLKEIPAYLSTQEARATYEPSFYLDIEILFWSLPDVKTGIVIGYWRETEIPASLHYLVKVRHKAIDKA